MLFANNVANSNLDVAICNQPEETFERYGMWCRCGQGQDGAALPVHIFQCQVSRVFLHMLELYCFPLSAPGFM